MLVSVSGMHAFNKHLQRGQLHGIVCGKYVVTPVRRPLFDSTPRDSRLERCIVVEQPTKFDGYEYYTCFKGSGAFKETIGPRRKSLSVEKLHTMLVG